MIYTLQMGATRGFTWNEWTQFEAIWNLGAYVPSVLIKGMSELCCIFFLILRHVKTDWNIWGIWMLDGFTYSFSITHMLIYIWSCLIIISGKRE